MEKLNEVAEFLERNPGLADCVVQITYSEMHDIAEAFRSLEQRAEAAEAKLAEIEKQSGEQKPFMYGIMTANGDAHFEDFCVSSDPGLLEDVIWEWNNTLADNEPKNRVVALFTRPAPAINLAKLVQVAMRLKRRYICNEGGDLEFIACVTPEKSSIGTGGTWDDWRELSAILRNIEEPK